MRLKFFGLIILCLFQAVSQGQGAANNKIAKQLPTSTYSSAHFAHDLKGVPDIKNPQNKVIDNLDNPPGTFVLDGNVQQKVNKALIDDPSVISFGENYVEISYKANKVTYRIPVNNISEHVNLSSAEIQEGLQKYNEMCYANTRQVPELITVEHDANLDCCLF